MFSFNDIVNQGRFVFAISMTMFCMFSGPSLADELSESGRALFSQYCHDCHAGNSSEADIDFEQLFSDQPLVKNRKTWRRIRQLIELKAMPPTDHDQPDPSHRKQMLNWIEANIDQFDYSSIDHPGWEPVRRMTHREYNNTVRDLLGIRMDLVSKFPRELVGSTGFENSANTLFLQPALMERYIAAAERATDAATRFGSVEVDTVNDENAADVLEQFLRRSFRRPITNAELNEHVQSYQRMRNSGSSPDDAIKGVTAGVLISPGFLLRVESQPNESGKVTDHELATRLSYFLWGSIPDDELFELADNGELSKPEVLSEQVRRMLGNRKSAEFVRSFVGQWLSTRLVGKEIRLDPIDQPWCTDSLMSAMRQETLLVFYTILKEDRPITDLVDADFTYVNEELGRTLYGIKSVRGEKMRRVKLKSSQRRGILGHASVLAVTSNHDETSPIKRGAYVLDRILGTPPPPPPPDAGELDEDLAENEGMSLAQKLRRHASDDRCSSCHQTIDPIGIALEGFGAYGRKRRRSGGSRIVTSATLADGHKLTGAESLRDYLLTERRDDFVRNFVVRVMEYALGRETEYYDEPAIRKVIAEANENDLRIQSIIHSVAKSYPFQHRKEKQP